MRRTLPLMLASLLLANRCAQAAEICSYTGATSYSGHASVRTEVTEAQGLLTIDVTARLEAKPFWLYDVQFLAQEISTWRAGELQSVAINGRYSANGQVKRQQWDVFVRGPDGLTASRAQAKTLPDFRRRHPGLLQAWDPARFGQPWLPAFSAAQPERRPDLDLHQAQMPPQIRTPFAMAFYWSRWLPPAAAIPLFLPGWKRDARLDAPITQLGTASHWRMTLRHPTLDNAPVSWADVYISPDHHLQRLAFDIHAPAGDGQGWIDQASCNTQNPARP